jgi:OPA family glycerol-3-phosphate transporter-like MFS transporter/OPA family sugar phosphate sensor protein UhpC-like MFS transporter
MAAATAIGMTGFFGYLSGVVSGWYLGRIVDTGGWDPAFRLIIAATRRGRGVVRDLLERGSS